MTTISGKTSTIASDRAKLRDELSNNGIQRRARPLRPELREESEKSPVIAGYASVFYDGTPDTEYELWSGLRERIMPGAFDRAIREDDVRALMNHDPDNLLGRTATGTLRLLVDKRGLYYEIDPPATSYGADLMAILRRGDISGSSFSFRVTGEEWKRDGDEDIIEITGVALYDVGPVTFPAYEATTAEARFDRMKAQARIRASIAGAKARVRVLDLGGCFSA